MDRKCARCKQITTEDDFLCPHCGAILGQPVSESGAAAAARSKKSPWRRICLSAAAILVTAVLGAAGWFMGSQFDRQTLGMQTTPPATAQPPATNQPTAPLRVYTATVKAEGLKSLSGIIAHIFLDGQELYSGELTSSGEVTFILPEHNGYSLRLSQLPLPFQLHYSETDFFFADGKYRLNIGLTDQPVPFLVKVMDSAGKPLAGVGIRIFSSDHDVQLVTDETGCCTALCEYGDGFIYGEIAFAPNGYVPEAIIAFEKGSLACEAMLLTYEEAGIQPEDIFTVRVVDANGEPVPKVSLELYDSYADALGLGYSLIHNGVTNLQGCYSFEWEDGHHYSVHVLDRVDSDALYFHLVKDSGELLIQLPTEPEPQPDPQLYTHTVTFYNQFQEPAQDVLIVLLNADNSFGEAFLSDENGSITFTTTEADSAKVRVCIYTVPQGYAAGSHEGAIYSFPDHSRRLEVVLRYEGKVDYTVTLRDENGDPVVGAKIQMAGIHNNETATTDSQGCAVFHLPATDEYQVVVVWLPKQYRHLAFQTVSLLSNQKSITLDAVFSEDLE